MLISLKEFQEKAVKELVDSCSTMLDRENRQNVLVLQSPTGSGKTIMAASFIDRLIRRREDEICFVWVTIGKGELQIQSKNSLNRFFQGSPVVRLIEDEFNGGRRVIERNEIIVVNWEKIRSKVRATGEWANKLMKDGEKTNFREVLANTREERKIILIIDESHIGATAERTKELRDEFDAHVVFEISATPKLIPDALAIKEGTGDFIRIPASVVIEEGLIKKDIIINQGLSDTNPEDADSQTVVLEKAFLKRLELQQKFDNLEIDINPLVLIQIPNAEEGNVKIEAIKNFLAEREVTEANGRLAIWIDNYPSSENLDGIALNTNTIQFLIFKQAIDTGWDCPRAQILVKFRETKSETFEIQILGRILRMPEQKHYPDDALNDAYVYTNISNINVKHEEYNPNIIKHLKMQRHERYTPIELPSYYKSRADYGDITGDFTKIFAKTACEYFGIPDDKSIELNLKLFQKKGIDTGVQSLKDVVLADSEIETILFDSLTGDLSGDEFAELRKSENDTQTEFNNFLERHMGTFKNVARSLPAMKSAVFSFLKNYVGLVGNKDGYWLQKMILSQGNLPHFELIFTSAVESFAKHKEMEIKHRVEGGEQHPIFEVPEEIYVNEFVEEIVPFDRNIMNPSYLLRERSEVEKTFENYLDSNSRIDWWFKNGVNKLEFLGIKYEFPENRIKSFYPDFIVRFLDGTIGVFETKSKGDDENFGGLNAKTKAKALAMNDWKNTLMSSGRKIRCGIVIVDNRKMLINESNGYDIVKANSGDWSEWIPFTI